MSKRKNVAVFGSASKRYPKTYRKECYDLGKMLAKKGLGVITGSGKNGAMGATSLGVKKGKGKLIGVNLVIWHGAEHCLHPQHFHNYHVEQTLANRKQRMKDMSCAFVVAPGGIGTLNEFWDVLDDLHCHNVMKPIIILNVRGFWNPIIKQLKKLAKCKFLHGKINNLYFAKNAREAFEIICAKGL